MSLDRLNKEQRKAATQIDGPILILAGAGSGKTSTMTERIAYMIENGISKYNILAVTFTNKAAKEMRERVESLVGNIEGMWITTFHSMCLRMLKKDPTKVGYDKNFLIYDTTDQKTLVKAILKDKQLSEKEFPVRGIMSTISHCKENILSPQKYLAENEDNYRTRLIAEVYVEYEKRLKLNNAMDFDDLLLNGWKLLDQNSDVLEEYRRRFRYVMVDEYQDTNYLQYLIVKLLAEEHQNICVVGDDDQCIYQWRGADITNILDFEKDFPSAKVIKLQQNYRSVGNILAGAHSVIENNRQRKRKKLWTDKEAGDKIRYYRAESERDEARYVAQEIENLHVGWGIPWNDIAVLYRTNAQSRVFERYLMDRGIPYRILSGMRYYDRKELKDLIAYMRLIINPKDDISLKRVINEPKRGIGPKTLANLEHVASGMGMSMMEALLSGVGMSAFKGKTLAAIQDFTEVIRLLSGEQENLTVSQIYDELLVRTGYVKMLESEATVESEGRLENLMEFKTEIADYEKETRESGGTSELGDFMEKLALMAEVDNHDESQDAIVLMTMHSSKGLEFPVVFLPGLEDGIFPGSRAMEDTAKMEEERRLCYVAMTRAKQRLFLTSAAIRTQYGRTDYTRESQFLRELDPRLLEGDAIYRQTRTQNSIDVPTESRDGFSVERPSKPFDMLKYAKEATKSNAMAARGGDVFHKGDMVNHTKFGDGLVIDEDERTLTVMFDSVGKKKLAKGIAHLRKQDGLE